MIGSIVKVADCEAQSVTMIYLQVKELEGHFQRKKRNEKPARMAIVPNAKARRPSQPRRWSHGMGETCGEFGSGSASG